MLYCNSIYNTVHNGLKAGNINVKELNKIKQNLSIIKGSYKIDQILEMVILLPKIMQFEKSRFNQVRLYLLRFPFLQI